MISIDTNILLYGFCEEAPFHEEAREFLSAMGAREDVGISEFVLSEFYLHLRSPSVLVKPLAAGEAVDIIERYRRHPRWRLFGFPPRSSALHATLWRAAAVPGFARRRIYDLRIALCLQAFGVREFATANGKDFEGAGFERVWNPLLANP